jgi:hypothetical protein
VDASTLDIVVKVTQLMSAAAGLIAALAAAWFGVLALPREYARWRKLRLMEARSTTAARGLLACLGMVEALRFLGRPFLQEGDVPENPPEAPPSRFDPFQIAFDRRRAAITKAELEFEQSWQLTLVHLGQPERIIFERLEEQRNNMISAGFMLNVSNAPDWPGKVETHNRLYRQTEALDRLHRDAVTVLGRVARLHADNQ